MRHLRSDLFTLALLSTLSAALIMEGGAAAQSTPDWNRAIGPFGATPTSVGPPGSYDLSVGWEFESVAAGATPGIFDTEVVYRVNGIDKTQLIVTASDPGSTGGGGNPSACGGAICGGSCGSATIGGSPVALQCLPDLGGMCGCRAPITSVLPGEPLTPGDEIMVLLRPAPGALPETDPSDDIGLVELGTWNRRVISVSSSPSTPGHVDLQVTWAIDLVGESTLPVELGGRFLVESGGTPQPGNTTDQDECLIWDLGSGGADISGVHVMLECDAGVCSTPAMITPIPDVPEPPVGPIGVIIRPVPGALPELPGFPDDDGAEVVTVPALSSAAAIFQAAALGIGGAMALIRRGRFTA
jgi:hypothetical protein